MEAEAWMTLLERVVDEVRDALDGFRHWSDGGDRSDNYRLDLIADERALSVLRDAGVRVLSEESGVTEGDSSEIVVVDPVDGSTNASRRIPHYATSLCVVDADARPVVALVVDLATGERFDAVAGRGARCDGLAMAATRCVAPDKAIVALAGLPPEPLGVAQVRSFGAASLDLSWVACGRLDGFVDASAHHGVWDYAAAALICQEAGVALGEIGGRDLFHLDHAARRGPVAAATPSLRDALIGRLEQM